MNTTELLQLGRRELADEKRPYLWSDADLYAYIDDAQKMFCRLTDGISDATNTDVTEVSVAPNDDWVDLHPSILTIRGITRSDDGCELERLNYEDLATKRLRFDGVPGKVKRLVIGMEENKGRLHPRSNETLTLQLLVYRLPLVNLTSEGDEEFEIAEIHHQHLLMWVKARAFGKQDAETLDKKKQMEFEAAFSVYCGVVKAEQARKRHKPRMVAYGGI